MKNHLHGCGNDERALTLYRLADGLPPNPLSGNYWHIRCGYRPPSRIQNGILLCNACIANFGLLAVSDSCATPR